jgi:signal transduction histidine kinase
LSETALDVVDWITQLVQFLQGRAANGWVDLTSDVTQAFLNLMGDGRFIKQILVYIVANAVKFSSTGVEGCASSPISAMTAESVSRSSTPASV